MTQPVAVPSPTRHDALPGRPEPLGVTLVAGGVNVAVFSRDAAAIELCLFDGEERETARWRLAARTGDIHHGFIPGIGAGQHYGLRAHGPFDPWSGLRFDPDKLLVDPYAARLAPYPPDRDPIPAEGLDDLARDGLDTASFVPKAIIEAPHSSAPRAIAPQSARVIYELHVRGFSMLNEAIPEAMRGTVAALAHPASLEHFRRLGVTTIELMPIAAAWDERHLSPLGLRNYWGYNTLAFLAPDPRLAPGGMAEVARTVATLHEAGLEVVLDVVFNHTPESDERGRTLSLRGLDNRTYYRLAEDPRFYVNDTGCGHTLALDRPAPMRLVLDALRHWALAGGFDGFRFDLAPVLGRRADGFDRDAPLIAAIEQDPVLRERLMIAEPWDIGLGGYRLGGFPARWLEWNDRYRDDVRRFWRGDGSIGALATRLAGSSDIFGGQHRRPSSSVNFVAAHDGFTLRDSLSYASKRNEANGEGNRDGHSHEVAFVSDDPRRDQLALLATLLVSRGTPMLAMGDELGRSQRGNNNAYAQDNPLTWLDWSSADNDLIATTAQLIAARRALAALIDDRFLTGDGDVAWLDASGATLTSAGWEAGGRLLLMRLSGTDGQDALVVIHAGHAPLSLELPDAGPGRVWMDRLTTAAPVASFDQMLIAPRSVRLFASEPGRSSPRRTGVPDALTDRLADLAGIAPEWWQVNGAHTRVSPETKRALLAAMGFPAMMAGEAWDSLDRLGAIAAQPDAPTAVSCHRPEPLHRALGVATQLYALRRAGDQGIGDFTTLADLAAASVRHGLATIALNPFHAAFPSDRGRASPYQPSDRRFLDTLMIDLEAVPEIGAARAFLAENEARIAALRSARSIDHAAVWAVKKEALRLAHQGFEKTSAARQAAFNRFVSQGGAELARFCLFQAIEMATGTPPSMLPNAVPPDLADGVRFAAYLQFLADEQLARSAQSGLSLGLYRDLAVGPAFDGAEVVTTPGAFLTGVTVGAPPDPFSAAGQVWNLPPLDPLALRRTDFAPWRALLAANMRHAGLLRIDHAMALRRLFLIPLGASPADGAYVRYPMEGMLRVLAEESMKARCLVVGEDLGTVPEGFRERLARANVLSYRVLFFERDGDRFRPPETYPTLAVACASTHDLPPLAGWWEGADIALDHRLGRPVDREAAVRRAEDRRAVAALAGAEEGPLTPALSGRIHAAIARTPSALALVQAEELAGERDPVNVPGTTEAEHPNWRRRLTVPVNDLFETDEARAILPAMRAER
jgi:glycogen operon protein